MEFEEGRLPEEMNWTTLVMVSKRFGEFRGIGLLEVIWKVFTYIISNQLRFAIRLHDALYGFRQGQGTGTATLEEKLAYQTTCICP